MGLSKWFFSASGVILLICALGLAGKGIDLGIDFESGTRIRASLERPADEDSVRSAIQGVQNLGDAEIQRVTDPGLGPNAFQISAEELRPEQGTAATETLDESFGVRGEPNTQSIGPTFGATVANNAIIAVIASLIVISVYIAVRFRWKFAV